MLSPDSSAAERQVRTVQANFRKVLSAWASDLLALRRDGLLLTQWVEPRQDPGLDSNRRVA